MNLITLDHPRWPGGPPLCPAANLPAFATADQAKQWHDAPKRGNPLYESNPMTKLWQCEECGQWHFTTHPRPPSGSSSGSSKR